MKRQEKVRVLAISLHDIVIGYLAGFESGRNIFTIAPNYIQHTTRPTLTLSQLYKPQLLETPWITNQRLHPVFSNLLPEGALRKWIAQSIKTHENNEFPLLAWLGQDLPGALIATPVEPQQIPGFALSSRDQAEPILLPSESHSQRFSLAGVQMKFSAVLTHNRFHISKANERGNWIIKTPSNIHPCVPLNEYSMMALAQLAGINIPEIKLIEMNQLNGLPDIALPNEPYAYAIKRFDRGERATRIHTEDFAQILQKFSHEKYQSTNYETIGKILYEFCDDGLAAAQQFARRLLVNILLANGDAHIKNWTVYYPDQVQPQLAPAYDILYTHAYIANESALALNLGGEKHWSQIKITHFQQWSKKVGVSWPAIAVHLNETITRARDLWPKALAELPILDQHKVGLKKHWQQLHADWRIT